MSNTSPPSGFHRGWLSFFCIIFGSIIGVAFHDLAGLRQFLPPYFVSGRTLACQDLDAYIENVADLQDHRLHKTTFGIHRQNTVDAVNELYDRARCGAHPTDDLGHEGYTTLPAKIEQDVNDPGPHAAAAPPRSYPLYSHGELVSPATAPLPAVTPYRPAVIVTNRHRSISGTLPRRTYTVDDAAGVGTLGPPPRSYMAEDVQAGTPAGAQDPTKAPPLHCGREANGIDWHRAGCP